jgi:hypothetical protein
LAELAQDYAETCTFGHESNEDRRNRFTSQVGTNNKFGSTTFPKNGWDSIGENIAYQSGTPIDGSHSSSTSKTLSNLGTAEFSVYRWAVNEAKRYTYGRKGNGDSCTSVCGHFTQVAWANTRYVGCGVADCSSNPASGKYKSVLVCNYYPAANMPNQYPYPCTPGASGCDASIPSGGSSGSSDLPNCVTISGTGKWYVDGGYKTDGTYGNKKAYIDLSRGRFSLFWNSGRGEWNVATSKGSTSVYARCSDADITACDFGGSGKTVSRSCPAAFSMSETPVGGTSALVVFLIILGFLLVGVGNCVFCYFMKRKMLGVQGMQKVLEEDEAIALDNVETETALTQA